MQRIEPTEFKEIQPVHADYHSPKYDISPSIPEETFEPSRPSLDPPGTPSRSLFSSLSLLMETLTGVQKIYLDVIEDRIKGAEATYLANFEKNLQQSRELDEQMKARDWWGFLQKIAACLIAACSLMSGGVIFANATATWEFALGSAMVISGISTIVGVTMNEVHVHPEIAAILTTVGSAMGLIGGAATALFYNATAQEMVGKVAAAAIGIVSGLSQLAKESYASKISHLQSANVLVHRVFETQQDQMKMLTSDAELYTQRMLDNVSQCTNIQRKYEQSIRKIVSIQEYRG